MLRTPSRVLTGALALLFLFPLVWAAVASVSPQAGTAQVHGWGLRNYQTLAEYQAGVGQYLLNSTAVSLMTVAFTLIVSGLGGYAFAMFTFPGRNPLFLVTLAILMVPYATLLIPLYVLLNDLGLQNTLVGLSLVLTMFQLPFAVFMMRNAFEALPRELEEAALVDGCSRWGVFWRVVIPVARGGLAATAVFTFVFAWNEFLFALVLTRSAVTTFPVQVTHYFGGQSNFWSKIAAMSVLGTAPIFVAVTVLQRFLVRGISMGAVKG